MISVSTAFKSAMSERTDFKAYATITLLNDDEILLDPSDFLIAGNSMNDGAGASGFPVGAAVAKTIQIEILNPNYTDVEFYGARIHFYLVFRTTGQQTESVNLGNYTVISPASAGETITITAADDMYRSDKQCPTNWVYPATLAQLFRRTCDHCGIPYTSSVFRNSNYTVQQPPEGEMTCRSMLGYIAMIAGGNARINRNGYCVVQTWDFPNVEPSAFTDGGTFSPWNEGAIVDGGNFAAWTNPSEVDGGSFNPWSESSGTDIPSDVAVLDKWINLRVHTDDVKITGLHTTKKVIDAQTEEETEEDVNVGTAGYVLDLQNPLWKGDELAALNLVGAVLLNKSFRIFDGEYLANPLIEFMDKALIRDRKGGIYNSVVTDVSFRFFGKTSIINSAETPLMKQSSYTSASAKAEQEAERLVNQERSARATAVAALQQALANSSGMYSTDVQQTGGGIIRYFHDKPLLSESTKIIKITADAIGFSTDGGQTYPFGVTIDGTTIMSIVASEGIVADWITAGTISDEAGKFEIDLENSTITVNDDDGSPVLTYSPSNGLTISGEITASTINGGTINGATISGTDFVVGGRNNVDGTLIVKNASGQTVVTLNNQGITATRGTFSGELSSPTGDIGGWTIGDDVLYTSDMRLDAGNERIEIGDMTLGSPYYTLGEGLFSTADEIVIAPDAPNGGGYISLEGDVGIRGELLLNEPLSIENGGTGADTEAGARDNLGIYGGNINIYTSGTVNHATVYDLPSSRRADRYAIVVTPNQDTTSLRDIYTYVKRGSNYTFDIYVIDRSGQSGETITYGWIAVPNYIG